MEIHLAPEEIFRAGDFNITNTLIVSMAFLLLFFILSKKTSSNLKLVPGRLQNFFESLIEVIFNFMDGVLEDRGKTKKFFPLVATIFIFVVVSNWL